jgi:hypothetical protein
VLSGKLMWIREADDEFTIVVGDESSIEIGEP